MIVNGDFDFNKGKRHSHTNKHIVPTRKKQVLRKHGSNHIDF